MPIVPYLVLGLVAATIIGMVIQKIWHALHRTELIGLDPEQIKETWKEILDMSDHGIMGAKVAIMEADKLLDQVLKSMMMPGDTLGERLKVVAYKYPNVRRVWPAHRLRNQLVHDAEFQITMGQVKGALRDYEQALKTLNVL